MFFDANYCEMWVVSDKCTVCNNGTLFHSSGSNTFKSNGTILDVEYEPDGALESQDTFTLGSVKVPNVIFSSLLQDTWAAHPTYDGVIGLRNWQYSLNCGNNMLRQMTSTGITTRSCIGFWMQSANSDIQSRGYAFIGGSNSSYYTGALTYTPFVDPYGGFIINSISMGSIKLATNNQTYLYTDNPFIQGPSNVITPLLTNLGIDGNGYINCCNVASLPNLTFTINSVSITLAPWSYVVRDTCVSMLKPMDNTQWYIGHTILNGAYVEYDYDNNVIGFANKNKNAN